MSSTPYDPFLFASRKHDELLAQFDDDLLAKIRRDLPGFASDESEAEFPVLLRAWASHYAGPFSRPQRQTQLATRKELERLAKSLSDAASDSDGLSHNAIRYLAAERARLTGKPMASISFDPDYINVDNDLKRIKDMAQLAINAAAAVEVVRGAPRDLVLLNAIGDLAWLFERLTGQKAARRVHVGEDEDEGTEYGPFLDFVTHAIAPIWPKAGAASSTRRRALQLWSQFPDWEPEWYSIGAVGND